MTCTSHPDRSIALRFVLSSPFCLTLCIVLRLTSRPHNCTLGKVQNVRLREISQSILAVDARQARPTAGEERTGEVAIVFGFRFPLRFLFPTVLYDLQRVNPPGGAPLLGNP